MADGYKCLPPPSEVDKWNGYHLYQCWGTRRSVMEYWRKEAVDSSAIFRRDELVFVATMILCPVKKRRNQGS